jgi:hypothetical protein
VDRPERPPLAAPGTSVNHAATSTMSAKKKKSWREKLADHKGLPRTGNIEGKMTTRWGTGTMVIPAPLEVDELMRCVPKGKLVTINELRAALARKHGVNIACPITTGIFSWLAAHAADEAVQEGARQVTPYWRTLKSGGELNPKYPGGIAALKKQLRAEGHAFVQKGQRTLVADFEKALVKWS